MQLWLLLVLHVSAVSQSVRASWVSQSRWQFATNIRKVTDLDKALRIMTFFNGNLIIYERICSPHWDQEMGCLIRYKWSRISTKEWHSNPEVMHIERTFKIKCKTHEHTTHRHKLLKIARYKNHWKFTWYFLGIFSSFRAIPWHEMNGHIWIRTALKLLFFLIRIKFFFIKFQHQNWIYKIFIRNSMLMSKRCDHLPCMRIVCHVYSNTQHRKNPHHYPEKFGKFLLSSLITTWHETPEVRRNWKMIIAVKLCVNLNVLSSIWLKDAKCNRFPNFFSQQTKSKSHKQIRIWSY